MKLTRRQLRTVATALQLAIEWDETSIECHRTQWAERGLRKIIPKSDRSIVGIMRRRVARNKVLMREIKDELLKAAQ